MKPLGILVCLALVGTGIRADEKGGRRVELPGLGVSLFVPHGWEMIGSNGPTQGGREVYLVPQGSRAEAGTFFSVSWLDLPASVRPESVREARLALVWRRLVTDLQELELDSVEVGGLTALRLSFRGIVAGHRVRLDESVLVEPAGLLLVQRRLQLDRLKSLGPGLDRALEGFRILTPR